MKNAPTVKICGIRDENTLCELLKLPVDQIGFVFAASRRRVTPEAAGEWIRQVRAERGPALHRTVGVFVEPSREELAFVLERAPVDIVQLHGGEPPGFCRWIKERFGAEVWRVVSVPSRETADAETAERAAERDAEQRHPLKASAPDPDSLLEPFWGTVDAVLLDTFDPVTVGGSGRTFPWTAIPPYREAAHRLGFKLIAAGGLNADNVRGLLSRCRPDGVDVSGGVETGGSKDLTKIRAFVERVKGLEQLEQNNGSD